VFTTWYHRALVYPVVAEDSRVLSYQVIDYMCNKDLIDLDQLVSDPLSYDRNKTTATIQ